MYNGRLTERNAAIAEMLADGERLKNLYRFTAQNPHINLHDACQIVIERPNVTVCYSFNEWSAMERRITKGRKGIEYYDSDGYKQFVFDANDTHGENRYMRPIITMRSLLGGLSELNGVPDSDSEQSDYIKIRNGVQDYLREQGELNGDEERDKLLVEGVAYSLYSKTGFPKSAGIKLGGLPYGYRENADFVKNVYVWANNLEQDIEEANREKQTEIKIIDDTDEENVSDEPLLPTKQVRKKVFSSAVKMYAQNYVILTDNQADNGVETHIYIGKPENLDEETNAYDNSDDSLIYATDRPQMAYLLYGKAYAQTQQELIDNGTFTKEDYAEYNRLKEGELKEILEKADLRFGIKTGVADSGLPFKYPEWEISEKPNVEEAPTVIPLYQKYIDSQKLEPAAVVLMRLGDFYEIMGENAVKVSEELDITLTGRDVGLKERVPMCGMPYHAMDKCLDKILERHSVLIVDGDEEPKYILSHTEARAKHVEKEEKKKPELVEITRDEPTPFDNEQPETDEDWRTELAEELAEENGQPEEEIAEPEEDESEELEEPPGSISEQPKDKVKSTPKKEEKGIKDRKRKPKPQLSMFDMLKPQEKSAEEALIERELKRGGSLKFRIFDKYNKNPTQKAFADFIKNEYGIGGYSSWEGDSATHDAKGITMSVRGKNGECLVTASLKWPEVAVRIADLIDDDNYFTEQEKQEYVEYKIEQDRQKAIQAEKERQKTELINKVIFFAPPDRKQRILDEYATTTVLTDFAEFLKNEYGTFEEHGEGYSAIYNQQGIWIYKGETYDYQKDFYLNWTEFADKTCTLIENDRYIEQSEPEEQPRDLDAEEDEDWDNLISAHVLKPIEPTTEKDKIKSIVDRIVKEGTENTSGGNWIIYLDEFGDDENFVREHKGEIGEILALREEVARVAMDDESIDTKFHLEFCPNIEEEQSVENTNLNGVLNQNELGGAKTRFRNNVAAIKLVNKLYSENRNPTDAEKKVLSQFVGWGGLSAAFDENNPQWKKEYAELKGILSQEDYEQARSSTLNAYYTPKEVIDGIYTALGRLGVKGNNRILEPSMGTGNFFGYMPQEIADGSRLYGVELDNLTGRIAAKLYPQANVQIKGFEDTSFPNDKFDIVVGNVPFGGYGIADSDYNRYNFRVHDYFLAKSIDKVKPEGIVAIVTSKGTMDKLNPNARKYVAERAELLGAIRLPNTAFKQTAGTEAVADILFFRKRKEKITDLSGIEWLGTGKTTEGFEINNYFVQHPEMVLGTLAEEHGLYGGIDITVKPDERDLSEALAEAVKNLPQAIFTVPEKSPEAESATEVDYNVKPMCYKAENGRLYMRVGDEMQEQAIPKFPKDAYQRIRGMIALRDELHHILDIQIQGCSDEVLNAEQRKLNTQYDLFVKKYGELNSQTNTRLFADDGDSALLFACEDIDKETQKISKSDIFYERTIRPYAVPTSTDDCFEALQISKNERGKVDIEYIEELTGKSYDDVLSELDGAVFRNPEKVYRSDKYSGFETSEEYLSGKVVEKLRIARMFAEEFPEYEKNVTALERMQPTPIKASDISVRLGQTWIGKEIYKQFYMELVGVRWWQRDGVQLFYNPYDSSWRLDQKDSVRYDTEMKQKEVYGTKRAPAYRLFIDCMNLKATTIYDTVIDPDGTERRVLNQAETIAAREKQNQIKEAFANWIFAKPERREELEAKYNRLFNQIRLPSYDGSYLKFPEMNPAIELRPHQKDAIHRIITNGQSTLLHHVVGSGKTYTVAASIMKMRQLGLCKKAMVAVPNHLVQQWAGEWRKLYPNAKILVATKEDLEKSNRRKFVSKVALGDWDGIIIAQSSFAKIPISAERQIRKLNEEINTVEQTIKATWERNGMPRGAVKSLEKIKKTKQAQLKKLMDNNTKDSVLTFENLGVDYLYIDEAHYYKNLFLFTKMNNVAGISNAASQRASDLKLKCEYMQGLHQSDRGVVFATGTPISNSMTEMYTMQSYLQPSMLKDIGIEFFDGWAADFGETVTSMELAPSGQGYKARTRFSKFANLPELQILYRSFADVITSDMVQLDVPKAEKHVINLKPSDTVVALAEQIAERAERIHAGGVPPEEDNMLKVTSDGKKLALDPRCFVPESADEEGSKLNEAAKRIYEIWENTADKKGTQIVFCDLSTPKVKSDEYIYGLHFDAYNDLKYKLVQKGIPAEEIAFIHDANTDEQKQTLFDRVNAGAIRVLIGSTEKCGAGTNVQKRLVALHHLDTPYRPSDMEQREGRIIRQGNTNEKVDIYTYVTERTFDSYSYQILENKSRFIQQIARGDFTAREYEDMDETTLSYAEIKAITAANPKIKRKMEVDTEIARLRVLEGQFKKNLYELQDKIRKYLPEDIRKQELLLERITADMVNLQANKPADPEAFEISVNGKVYTDKKEGGKALTEALYAGKPETVIAEYLGFKISLNHIIFLKSEREITLTANGQYTLDIGESASGNLTRLDNFIEDFPKRQERVANRLEQLKSDLEVAKEQAEKKFEYNDRLAELLKEQSELNTELNLDKREESVVIDDGEGSDEGNYRMLPTQRQNMEEKIIDETDKVAEMQVDILPDYTVTQEQMRRYGYLWNGMLPMRKDAASRAFSRGVQIYRLSDDDKEREVESADDFEDGALYGVEKPVWKIYLESEHGKAYMAARSQIAEASGVVTSGEMDIVAEQLTGDFIQKNYEERTDLDDYLSDKPTPSAEAMKEYAEELLSEYTERIWSDGLKEYGWDKNAVRRSIIDHIENADLKAAVQEIPETDNVNYEVEVINSVVAEFDEFKTKMLQSSTEEVFLNNYKIHLFNEFSEVIQYGKEYLTDKEFKALYEDRGHILNSLYDDYCGSENYSVETYVDTAAFIKDYCEAYHNEIYYPITYYGKDTEGRAYYSMTRGISFENLKWFDENADTDMITVAAPECYVSQEELEKHHIFYLQIGKDIQEKETVGEKAISNMMAAMDRFKRIEPVYLQTATYANEHAEMIAYRESHKLNEECRQAIDEAIQKNFNDNHLDMGFVDGVIEKYGMERVTLVFATTINEHEWDGRYKSENKDWAKTIPMSESDKERNNCCLNAHPALIDGVADKIRERQVILYTIVTEKNADGLPCFNAYYLDRQNGEVKYLDGNFSSNIALQAVIDQNADIGHKGYEYKLIDSQEFYAMSEKLKAAFAAKNKTIEENQNKEENSEVAQDKFKHFTARGDKVLSIIKDRDDRNIAIIQREKIGDYVVAAGYTTTDGKWAQGKYDFKTLEAAEKYREEKYGYENTTDTIQKEWLTFKVSPEALIKKYSVNSRFMMPKGSGYEGYAYSIFNDRIKEGTITTDLKSDTRERALVIQIPNNKNIEISGKGETIEIEPHEFISLVNKTRADKYERELRYVVNFPPEAFVKEYETSMLLAMPNDTKYKGYVYYLPTSVITEDIAKDDGTLNAHIGESFKVTLRKGEERVELTAKEYVDLVGGKKADKYVKDMSEMDEYREQQGENDKKWSTVAVNENAVIANYKESTLLKMPKGEYAGFVYYIPSGMVNKTAEELYLRIPEDFTAHLKNGDEQKDLTAQELIAAIGGKTSEDYEGIYRKPSEEAIKQFEKTEEQLRKNVPPEMLNKPNWVVVRTRENNETGRLDKFLISPHTGKFAESDNPETWSDFDTACKYAKENGGVCLAYALDGKDGIACIDLDGCINENGEFSEIAQKTVEAANGSYTEKSVSGKGLHIFGKTKGANLRSFSKDKSMEYYQSTHFIAMTGNNNESSELKSFDTPEMRAVLESKLEKRTEWKNTGKGIEGLSSMDDREVLDKAFGAKNGDTVKRLYKGEDLRGNHSNSDMLLMNYLAFWSNHDIDQMLRIFSSSGLYRPDKPQSYYEYTAIKAIKGTPCYTPNQKSSSKSSSGSGNDSGKGGK